jgi:hypothetical protein
MALSALETGFPHVVRRLLECWHTPAARPYLDSLILDDRGGRRGFPPEVFSEILLLHEVEAGFQAPPVAPEPAGPWDELLRRR